MSYEYNYLRWQLSRSDYHSIRQVYMALVADMTLNLQHSLSDSLTHYYTISNF